MMTNEIAWNSPAQKAQTNDAALDTAQPPSVSPNGHPENEHRATHTAIIAIVSKTSRNWLFARKKGTE